MLFTQLDLINPILKSLEKQGYTKPTPIQQQSIPHILEGRDVL
jgi:ATP-dependent RNA helicase RhlE